MMRKEEKQEVLIGIITHSPKNSFRKVHSSSSPSPVRNHKRRTGVDELQGEMNKIKPPTFDGEHKKDEDVETSCWV
jgi:hypothetical protein